MSRYVGTVGPARRALPLLVAALLFICGCTSHKGAQVALLIAGTAAAGDPLRCGGSGAQAGATVTAPVTTVRVTLRSRSADGKTVDFCDYKFSPGSTPPFLSVPDKGATALDVFVEAFAPASMGDPASADGVHRYATGAVYGIGVNPTTLAPLRLYQSEQFACARARLAQPRAFHTATLLPDGRVLFDGGLVADSNNAATAQFDVMNGAYVTGGAEIYDPRDQSMRSVNEPKPPAPRAFHAAQLLDGNGPCPANQLAVLLVGGLTNSPGVGQPILQPSTGLPAGRLWPQTPMGALSSPLPTRAIGNEVLCFDPDTLAGTRMPISGLPAGQRATGAGPHGLVAAGGIDYEPTLLNQQTPVSEVASFNQMTGQPTTAAVGVGRDGASLSVLSTSSALVWGGGATTDPVGELLGGLDGTPTSAPINLTGTPVTQFHTATLLASMGDPSILVTGGFVVLPSNVATEPASADTAVRLLTVNAATTTVTAVPIGFGGTYVADPTCVSPARYRPAGWEAATALPRGARILVSGGSPSTQQVSPLCQDCPGTPSLLCAIGQASIYDVENNVLLPTGALSVPRFGHTSTQLLDGSVLVAGGIGEDIGTTTTTVFLSDLEVYNSRTLLPPYDATTVLDLDDPIYTDLSSAKLHREPGKLAVAPGAKSAAKQCDTL